MIKKPKTKRTETEEDLKKTEFDFMIDLKTLIRKTSLDQKLLQLKNSVPIDQKDETPRNSSVFRENTERFDMLIYGDRIVIPERLKRPLVDALQF